MTTYNAKDLIEQAQMLADLQNSDFISWKENMMFLDNAWADLYQQIINHGDKTFLETFTFTGHRITLPDDFYQLYYVCYSDGVDRRPINRKAKTENVNGPYYDLVGNELVIYNKMNSIRTIEVQYFPTRQTITFAADDKKIEEIDGIIDTCDTKVFFTNGTNYYIKDLALGTIDEAVSGFMLSKSGVVSDTTKPYFKNDNRAYYSEFTNNTLTISKKNGTVYKVIADLESVPNFPVNQINAITEYGIFWAESGVLKFWSFDTKTVTNYATGLISNKVYAFDNSVYYETTEGIYQDGILIINSKDYDTFNGVMKVDLKTGYGILTDNSVIKSAFNNSDLDYPNNFYFNYLAYKLAVYYKIKQNADYTGLALIANDALKVFYDTLPKDENEYVRIANVYAK